MRNINASEQLINAQCLEQLIQIIYCLKEFFKYSSYYSFLLFVHLSRKFISSNEFIDLSYKFIEQFTGCRYA